MIRGLPARVRSFWRGVRNPSDVAAEMSEEFRHHLELRIADLVRRGLSPADAARHARLEFGSTDYYLDVGREARGLRHADSIRISWLDLKLGFRMLVRYPGLTLVGGLALAFAIAVGAGTFELVHQLLHPTLPLDEGDRVVGIRLWHAAAMGVEEQASYDFVVWRGELKAIRDVGAFRERERNVIAPDGRAEAVDVVEMSASGFRVARVVPLHGRTLMDADELPGAPPVAVIGYGLWQSLFQGEADIVGRTLRIAGSNATVVGVMPEGFAFPVSHDLWTPLSLSLANVERRKGTWINVFGRLADGVTFRQAQAELAAAGLRLSAEFPDTHEHIRPQLMPYPKSIIDVSGSSYAVAMSVNLLVILLLVLVCANVALLMFARAATREREIAVRAALGAGRWRIVTQLFAEALVLGSLAAALGLVAVRYLLRWAISVAEAEVFGAGNLPFWFGDRLSPVTVLYTILLTVLAAAIAGVIPGLKVTRGLGMRLKGATASGGMLRFGGVWTGIIVVQVAVTIAFPVVTHAVRRDAVQIRNLDVGVRDEEYLTARVQMDPSAAAPDASPEAFRSRFRRCMVELERRLTADPAVAGVTFADVLPRMYHDHRLIEVDAGGTAPMPPDWPAYRVSAASVGLSFFDVFEAPMHRGRRFTPSEHETGGGAPRAPAESVAGGPVIVNESFVRLVLGGRNAIGRRLRYVRFEGRPSEGMSQTLEGNGGHKFAWPANLAPPAWYEIVGVVRDLGTAPEDGDSKVAGIYHPVAFGALYPAKVAIHVKGDAASFGPRLYALATSIDPTLRLDAVLPMTRLNDTEIEFINFWFRILLIVSAMALTLSLAGIYSVMSFTVARRTREIGIRVALGGDPRRVMLAVFARPLAQVTVGALAGAALVMWISGAASYGGLKLAQCAGMAGYSALMFGVCLLACVGPTLRALRVEPTEALRADG